MNHDNTPMYFEAVSVDAELPDNGMICVVLAGGRIPMMSQMRAPNEWWTLGMANATKYEKGITHWLKSLQLVSEISDEEIEKAIRESELPARSGDEWLSLFEGAKFSRDLFAPTIAVLKKEKQELNQELFLKNRECELLIKQLAAEKEKGRENAIGFAEWIKENRYEKYWGNEGENCGKWYVQYTKPDRKYFTTSELFNFYLTSFDKQSEGK